jgi:hypothetical protein
VNPVPTDFWGIVVPTWVGAVGSLSASLIAVAAFLYSRSAQGGVKAIGESLNQAPTIERVASGELHLTGAATATVGPPHPWSFMVDGPTAVFRNEGTETVTVTGLAGTDGVNLTRVQVPIEVPASASFEIRVHRILGGPAVRGITIDWTTASEDHLSRTYYL